jgi:hypothetical protein
MMRMYEFIEIEGLLLLEMFQRERDAVAEVEQTA